MIAVLMPHENDVGIGKTAIVVRAPHRIVVERDPVPVQGKGSVLDRAQGDIAFKRRGNDLTRHTRRVISLGSAEAFTESLATALGEKAARSEVQRALRDDN